MKGSHGITPSRQETGPRRALIAAAVTLSCVLTLVACGGAGAPASPTVTHSAPPSDLARGGTINVGLDMSDAAMVRVDPTTLEPFGIAVDLESRLDRQSGLATNTIQYASATLVLAGLGRTEWDVAFLPIAAVRAAGGQASSPIAEVEQTYLVLGGAPIHTIADVDATGHRVAVESESAADASLGGTLKLATVVKAGTDADALAMLKNGTAEAMAGSRASLAVLAAGLPGSRVLAGSFATVPYGIATPAARPGALTYLNTFAAAAASTVKTSIARDALPGVTAG